jgi:putative membrane protein
MERQAPDPRVGLAEQRTGLAKFRTQLALDRTALAWIRTALTMATFGFGTVGFFRSLRGASPTPDAIQLHQSAIRFGLALVVLGIGSTVLAGLTQWRAAPARSRRGAGLEPLAVEPDGEPAPCHSRSGGALVTARPMTWRCR